jgi:hypothetical protein
MAKALGIVGVGALAVTLVSVIVAIWLERESAAQFLELTRTLLSWKVLASGLIVGTGMRFSQQIGDVLERIAGKAPAAGPASASVRK